jgi:hypothetical protein
MDNRGEIYEKGPSAWCVGAPGPIFTSEEKHFQVQELWGWLHVGVSSSKQLRKFHKLGLVDFYAHSMILGILPTGEL